MARRGIPEQVHWFLKEWMDSTEKFSGRGGQARMMEETGWSRATMSQLYNGIQDYSPKLLIEAANALNVETWELLMTPARAAAIRRAMAEQLRPVEKPRPVPPTPALESRKVRKRAVRT